MLEEDYHEYVKVSHRNLPILSHIYHTSENVVHLPSFILAFYFYLAFPGFKHKQTCFQLEGHSLDKRCHMVQRDGQMVIDKVTTVGEVRKETTTPP